MEYIIPGIIAILVLILIFTNIRIVPQTTEFVVERLGKYRATWSAGLHVKLPIVDKIMKQVTVKEQVLDTPPQPVITKDNVTMQIDSIVYFHIFDAKLFAYGAVDPVFALGNLSATSLRNIVGELTLDETLTSRDTINGKMHQRTIAHVTLTGYARLCFKFHIGFVESYPSIHTLGISFRFP